jgi:hypothetical protein
VCLVGRAVGPELLCFLTRIFELRAHICRDEIAVLDVDEAVSLEGFCVLSVQESAGDSASPEVDVPLPLLGYGALDRDIRDLDPSSGSEHAEDL